MSSEEGRLVSVRSVKSPGIHRQEADRGEGLCSAHFLLLIQPKTSAPGNVLPTSRAGPPAPLNQSRSSLTDMCRALSPVRQWILPHTSAHTAACLCRGYRPSVCLSLSGGGSENMGTLWMGWFLSGVCPLQRVLEMSGHVTCTTSLGWPSQIVV